MRIISAFLFLGFVVGQAPKASIEGTVTQTRSGEPLARARVTLTRVSAPALPPTQGQAAAPAAAPPPIPPVVTESNGRFVFNDLEPGQYRLRVACNGYAAQEYGQRAATTPGTVLILAAGQQLKDVAFRLIPGSIVTGRVRDSSGAPVAGIQVSLMRAAYNASAQRNLTNAGGAMTDDRGEYRIFWMPSGRYVLSAAPSSSADMGLRFYFSDQVFADRSFPVTYYPGTLDPARASAIELQPGSELGGIDIVLPQPSGYRIRGRVVDGSTGRSPRGASVSVTGRQDSSGTGSTPVGSAIWLRGTFNGSNGTFEIRNVPAGSYWLRSSAATNADDVITPAALAQPRTAAELFDLAMGGSRPSAQIQVDVNASDIEGVVLTLAPGVSIPIRLGIEGQELSAVGGFERVRVALRPADAGASGVTQRVGFNPEGLSTLEGIPEGEYRVAVSSLPQPDLYVKEVRLERIDVLNDAWRVTNQTSGTLHVLLSSKGSQVAGNVVDSQLRPAGAIQVVLIPDQGRDRPELYKSTTTDQNGNFEIRGIAPGGYKAFAWETLEPNSYFDRDVLSQYEQLGKPIRIQESSKETIDLKVIPPKQ